MGMFVDIEALSEAQSNAGLEYFYKAIHDHGDDESIWSLHPSPFVRRLIELFSDRGLLRLESFREELLAWMSGQRHTHGGVTMPRPDGAMERWTGQEIGIVRLYLETLPPERWTIDDHMMMVDYLVQRYLPADDLRSDAEWMVTRASLMGRVQKNLRDIDARQADVLLAAMPLTVRAAESAFHLPLLHTAILDFARVRAAEHVVQLADGARHRMRSLVAEHIADKRLGLAPSQSSLETKLLDEFATLNRDWRRIAVTEAGEAQNNGYIASVKPGTKVRRIEQYMGRCSWCAAIDGRVFDVVDPSDPDRDGDTQIWVGKNNVGRSSATRKRVGAMLVEREPHEMWWVAAGTQHPHCRGTWSPVLQDEPGDDPEFGAWLREHLGKKHDTSTELA